MADKPQDAQPMQKTRPRGINKKTGQPFKPVKIPVPTRKGVEDFMRGVAADKKPEKPAK